MYSKVYAEDNVGHTSTVISSDGVTVDITPPVAVSMSHATGDFVDNPSFEESNGCFVDIENMSMDTMCGHNCATPVSWNISNDDCVESLRSDVDTAFHGRAFSFVKGYIRQTISGLTHGDIYRVTFVASHLPIGRSVISNIEGRVRFGDAEHIFMLYLKDSTHGSSKQKVVWHQQSFYFKSKTESADLVIDNLNRNIGLLIDNVRIHKVIKDSNDVDAKRIHINIIALHQWSSIHSSWQFVDTESPIIDYLWAIGKLALPCLDHLKHFAI
jgi:hypothetical protein